MDSYGLSVLWYMKSKPIGKVKRRVQEMRKKTFIPVSDIDLSHNESARLATDALLNQGLEAYQEVLAQEGEVDFLSKEEKGYILENVRDLSTSSGSLCENDEEQDKGTTSQKSSDATELYPDVSESEPPRLEHGWPVEDWSYHLLGIPRVEVYFQSDRAATITDLLREFIRKATTVLAIVMDTFSDVEIFCDILEATMKRNVSVYILLDHVNLHIFVKMCEDLQISSQHLTKVSIRSVQGETYCAKSGRKFTGQIKEKFIIIDCTEAIAGSYSFTRLSWQVDRSLAVHFKGSAVKPFDLEFRKLYASSKPVPAFLTVAAPLNLPLPHIPDLLTSRPAGLSTPQKDHPCSGPTAQPRYHNTQTNVQLTTQGTVNQLNYTGNQRLQWVSQRHTASRPVVRQRSFNSDYCAGNLTRRPFTSNVPPLGGTWGLLDRGLQFLHK